MYKCRYCQRPLTSPASILEGAGPVCQAHHGMSTRPPKPPQKSVSRPTPKSAATQQTAFDVLAAYTTNTNARRLSNAFFALMQRRGGVVNTQLILAFLAEHDN